MTEIEPFEVAFGEDSIADLRDRLRRARWPEPATVDDWSQGVPLSYLQEVCGYWADGYDFGAAQARLNAFPQYRTSIDGLGIHFIHVRSPHANAVPLILTHGWPGSVVEFLGVIEALANPAEAADAFHVVVPSLPGYGFSDRPDRTGWGLERIADAWDELMQRVGYERYGTQGGDWGAMVATSMAQRFPERVIGVHVNLPVVALGSLDLSDVTPAEQQMLAAIDEHRRWGRGYSEEQSTRPQTVGYGLTDSPVGQCSWILEKFWAWTDCDGHPENALTKEQMLDNISVYWFTATATSSARLYWESLRNVDMRPIEAPSGLSVFPREIIPVSRRWAETRYLDLRWFNELDVGGHFAAFEQPAIFVDEVRSFFRLVR
jgi:pimeloyl-ACP methyl ester carboxylesterase